MGSLLLERTLQISIRACVRPAILVTAFNKNKIKSNEICEERLERKKHFNIQGISRRIYRGLVGVGSVGALDPRIIRESTNRNPSKLEIKRASTVNPRIEIPDYAPDILHDSTDLYFIFHFHKTVFVIFARFNEVSNFIFKLGVFADQTVFIIIQIAVNIVNFRH